MKGYQAQPDVAVSIVNEHKIWEERLLQAMEELPEHYDVDPRWMAIARTHFEQGFMALNRAVFKPQRFRLPDDDEPGQSDASQS